MNLWSQLIVIPSRKHFLFNCLPASAQQEKRCRHLHRPCKGCDVLSRSLSAPVLARSETSLPLRGDATCPPVVLKAFCDSNTIDRGGAGTSEGIQSLFITGRSPPLSFHLSAHHVLDGFPPFNGAKGTSTLYWFAGFKGLSGWYRFTGLKGLFGL